MMMAALYCKGQELPESVRYLSEMTPKSVQHVRVQFATAKPSSEVMNDPFHVTLCLLEERPECSLQTEPLIYIRQEPDTIQDGQLFFDPPLLRQFKELNSQEDIVLERQDNDHRNGPVRRDLSTIRT